MANEQKTKEHASRRPEDLQRRFAQDLPGASGGSRQRWRSMINGGSPEQPDEDGTAHHDQAADLPPKPIAPKRIRNRQERLT